MINHCGRLLTLLVYMNISFVLFSYFISLLKWKLITLNKCTETFDFVTFALLALLTCKKYSATIIVLLCISKDLYSRKDMNLTRFTIDCMLRGENKWDYP
jgi:hypothetical protein